MENKEVKITYCPRGFAYGYWQAGGIVDSLTSFMEKSRGEYTPVENLPDEILRSDKK